MCTYGVSAFATCTRKRDNTTDNVYPILNTANEIHQNDNKISLYYDASDSRSIIVYFLYVNGVNRLGYSGIAVPADFDRKVEYLLLYNSSKNACPLQRERRIMKPFLDAWSRSYAQRLQVLLWSLNSSEMHSSDQAHMHSHLRHDGNPGGCRH